jgi:8-amino-7-oxononanoate synthase
MKSDFYNLATRSVEFLQKNDLLPFIPVIESAHSPIVKIDNKKYYLFSSNSYLGLNINKNVTRATKKAIDCYGTGGGNSRLLSGTLKIHKELEAAIASFKNTDDAIAFPAGFMVNLGVIPALTRVFTLDPSQKDNIHLDTVILSDEYNHASIIEGCRLSNAQIIKYKHCNVDDLYNKIKDIPKSKNIIIVTDGVFSLDGDIAPLDKIVDIAKSFSTMVIVDDAHGTGVLGKTGRGIIEHYNLHDEIDVMVGTFSKALATAGGFVAGKKALIDYLRIAVRTYLFTASIPPSVAATVIACLEEIDRQPGLIERVRYNAELIRTGFVNSGFNILNTATPVIPLIIGDEHKTINMSLELFNEGIIAPAVRYPAVPIGSGRIRFTASALHSNRQIEHMLGKVRKIGRKLKII